MVYNNLSTYAIWFTDDYLSLDIQQHTRLQQQLDGMLSWHRSTQLPLYINSLGQLIAGIKEGLTLEKLDTVYTSYQEYRDTLIDSLAPVLIGLLSSASPQQIEDLLAKMDKQAEKYRKEHLQVSVDMVHKKKANQMKQLFSQWVGSLKKEQQQAIDEWSTRLVAVEQWKWAEQTRWREELSRLFYKEQTNEEAIVTFKNILYTIENDIPSAYRQSETHNTLLTKQLLVQLDESLTKGQRAELIKRLSSLLTELKDLAMASQ
jgi:hypothetical protein